MLRLTLAMLAAAGLLAACNTGTPGSFAEEARSEGVALGRTDGALDADGKAVCRSLSARSDARVPGYRSSLHFGPPNVGVPFGVVGDDAQKALVFVQLARRWYCPAAPSPT